MSPRRRDLGYTLVFDREMIGHGKGTRHFESFHICEISIALVRHDAFKRDSPILKMM